MACRKETFSLHLDSSDDEHQSPLQSQPRYRAGALPELRIPSPFQSEESSLELESGSNDKTPSTPGTPSTPLSPLGTELSFLAMSSQTSDPGEFATPRLRKKRFSKRRAHNFIRTPLFGTTSDASPTAFPSASPKRTKFSCPKSEIFSDVYFPAAEKQYSLMASDSDKLEEQYLLVPRGNQIYNLEILAGVFTLFSCPDKACYGRPQLH